MQQSMDTGATWRLSQNQGGMRLLPVPRHLLLFVPAAGNGCASLQVCEGVGRCLLSSWSLGNLSSLLLHRKLHSGMKTYGCELCGKRFLDSLRLRMHLLAHSGRQGLLQWPHVGTDTHLLPIFPLNSELAWPQSDCLHCQPRLRSTLSLGSSFQFRGAEKTP